MRYQSRTRRTESFPVLNVILALIPLAGVALFLICLPWSA